MITRLALARWISIAGHPFSFTALLVVVAGSKRYGVGETMRPDPPHVDRVDHTALDFHVAKMAVGTLANSRCFRRRRSPRLLRRRTSVARTTHELLCRGGGWSFMLRGSAAVAVLLGLAAVLNRWIKLSNHVAFAMFTGILLRRLALSWGLGVLVLVPFVAWSRLALSRHTSHEVLGGMVLGALVGAPLPPGLSSMGHCETLG